MTGDKEDPGQTAAWVQSHRTTYPFAYDRRSALSDWFDVRSIPYAVLVDPEGIVVWKGHPARLSESTLAAALVHAIGEPISGWPKSTMELQLLLKQGRYARASSAAASLGEPYRSFVADRVRGKVEAVERAHDAGDYLAASDLGERVVKELAGLREATRVKALLDAMRRDRDAQRILSGQRRVAQCARALAGARHAGEAQKLRTQLTELAREFPGTVAGAQAEACLKELERRAR